MAYAFITSVAAASPDRFDFTSAAVDTSGADFIVVATAFYGSEAAPTLTDSKTNTWQGLTIQTTNNDVAGRLVYAINPTVGAGHTFSLGNGTASYSAMIVAAFSGSKLTAPFDVENGGVGFTVTTKATGSITPSANNELIVAGLAFDTNTASIDSGLTIVDQLGLVGGQSYGVALAYKIQTAVAAINPAWSWSAATNATAEVASFNAAAAALATDVLDGAAWRGAWRGVLRGA